MNQKGEDPQHNNITGINKYFSLVTQKKKDAFFPII